MVTVRRESVFQGRKALVLVFGLIACSNESASVYIKASNTAAGADFGSVALSADGSTLAVGARGEASRATGINGDQADRSASEAGAVYVFTRAGGTWSQQAYIKASNTGAGDYFGSPIALSSDGSTLVVGAPDEGSSATGIDGDQADNSASNAGAVYVFTRVGRTWSQQAYVKASNTDAGDRFGYSLALSSDGSTLVVGAPDDDSSATGIDGDQTDNSASGAGAAYVFTRTGVTWSQQAYLKASNAGANDYFGSAVALSSDGSTLAVSAQNEGSRAPGIDGDQTDDSASGAGAAYVYTRVGATWSQQAYVKASNPDAADGFGFSVAISSDGSTLAVGSPGEGSNTTGIDGDQADNSAFWAGAAYVYTRTGVTWAQQAYVKASNTDEQDFFGIVAISSDGSILLVGAPGEASGARGVNGDQTNNRIDGAGAAYEFTRADGRWSQKAYLKASNAGAAYKYTSFPASFGGSVAISLDGSTIAVGAGGEVSGATGINGNQNDHSADDAGAVYIF